jgi:LmbE family N-acetylglucosaminyl deacetylase
MKFLNFNKVLCLSPHPDDVEYGMLGSMMKYKDTKFDIVTLSIGGKFDKSSSNTRHQECEQVWKHIDNIEGHFSDIKHIKEVGEDEIIFKLEKKYDLSEYEAIFVPPAVDSHQDHRKLNSVASSLVRKDKCSIIEYATPSTLTEWIPNYFVDLNHVGYRDMEDGHSKDTNLLFLASTWYIKLNKLKFFESQQDKSYFGEEAIKSFHSNYECSKKDMYCVERFNIKRVYN